MSKIGQRLKTEKFLQELEEQAKFGAAAVREIEKAYKGKGDVQEAMLDACMTATSAYVLEKTLERLDPEGRTEETRLFVYFNGASP